MNITAKALILIMFAGAGLGCGYSKPSMSTTPPAMPAISALNPASATHGGGSFLLEVDGSSFSTNAVINFNSAAQTTTSGGSSKVTATIPASAITNAGTVPVTVTNPGTGGVYGTPPVTSAAMNFMIN